MTSAVQDISPGAGVEKIMSTGVCFSSEFALGFWIDAISKYLESR